MQAEPVSQSSARLLSTVRLGESLDRGYGAVGLDAGAAAPGPDGAEVTFLMR